jgi:glycine/D-amino acid oxidase-like deaminating enzyme
VRRLPIQPMKLPGGGKSQFDFEVIVVGAGPAGLAAAIAARRFGFKTLIVDALRPPIDKACGEGLFGSASGFPLHSVAISAASGSRTQDTRLPLTSPMAPASAFGEQPSTPRWPSARRNGGWRRVGGTRSLRLNPTGFA